MSDNPAVATNEYVSNEALERIAQQVNALSNKVNDLDNRVQTTIDKRLLAMEERLIDRMTKSQASLLTEIDGKLKNEREDRIAADRKMSERLDKFSNRTNETLETISNKIALVSDTVNRVDGTIGSWHVAVEATSDSFKQAQRRLDETENRLDSMSNRQQLLEEKQKQTHKTIHGDASEDGPDSLFKAIANLSDKFTLEFKTSKTLIDTVLGLAQKNSRAIEKIEQDRLTEKERWSKRMAIAKEYTNKALTTPWFWVTVIITVVGLFVTINPATQDFFTKLIAQIFTFFRL